jgi:hypothetical protein
MTTTVVRNAAGRWCYSTRGGRRYARTEMDAFGQALTYARVRGLTVRYYASGK